MPVVSEILGVPVLARVLVVGQSIDSGFGVTNPGKDWVSLAAAEIGFVPINFSVPGARLWEPAEGQPLIQGKHGAYRYREALRYLNDNPSPLAGVIFRLGINDWSVNVPIVAFMQQVYGLLVDAFLPNPVPVLVVTPLAVGPAEEALQNAGGFIPQNYRDCVEFAAIAFRGVCPKPVTIVKGETVVPYSPETYSDPIHPDSAQVQIAAALVPTIRSAFGF